MSDNERDYEGQWQYVLAICASPQQFIQKCNEMGAKRWELVQVDATHAFPCGYFKRPGFDNSEPHHMVHDNTGGGVFDLNPPAPVLPDADKRDANGEPKQAEPSGFAAHAEHEQALLPAPDVPAHVVDDRAPQGVVSSVAVAENPDAVLQPMVAPV